MEQTRYETKISAFEGPLDLLLHLVKETKVDIHEVSISEITRQYLDYIKAMTNLHLEIASEYLVMAANLMLIKSKRLLPKEDDNIDDDYEEDTEAELRRRLIEYQMYKDSLAEFRKLEEIRGLYYTKPAIDFSPYVDEYITLDVKYDTSELILAFEKLLRRQKLDIPMPTTIVPEKVTVNERIVAIENALLFNKRIYFKTLFDRFDKEYIVVTFLALLEMTKVGEIFLKQEENNDDILIIAKGWLE